MTKMLIIISEQIVQKLILMECVKFDGRRLENGNSGKTYCIPRNFFLYFVLVIEGAEPS